MDITKNRLYLFMAGLILILVGSFIGFLPTEYLTQFFDRGQFNIDVLSEMRGMGGSLFVMGLFVFSATFIKRIENSALIISALIYCSFSIFRFLGFTLEGVPSTGILIAFSIEILLAALATVLIFSRSEVDLN